MYQQPLRDVLMKQCYSPFCISCSFCLNAEYIIAGQLTELKM